MKLPIASSVLVLATISLPLSLLAQPRASTEAFLSSSDFGFAQGDLHFAELATSGNAEQSTHLLIEGLVPVEAGSDVVTSSYTAIDLNSGDELEIGQLYFTLPSGATSTAVASSPIVGIVAREGTWENNGATEPSSSLGGASGILGIDVGSNTLTFSLSAASGETYTGEVPYSRVSDNAIELPDFTLTSSAGSIEFYGTQLFYFGGKYYGVIQSKDGSADDNSLMYTLNLTRTPDFDGDGVPDLSDTEIGSFDTQVGVWKYDNGTGWITGIESEGWGYSQIYGYVFTDHYPWLYLNSLGRYIYFALRGGETVWLYDPQNQAWIYTGDYMGVYGIQGQADWAERFYPRPE